MIVADIPYASARHEVVALGVLIKLSVTASGGAEPIIELLSPTAAKRLAWGILSDLEPAQAQIERGIDLALDPHARAAEAAAWRAERQRQRDLRALGAVHTVQGGRRRVAPRGQVGPDSQAGRLLSSLLHGELRARELCALSGVPLGVIGARMLWLRQRGLVARIDGDAGHGHKAVYRLTDAGRGMLEAQS